MNRSQTVDLTVKACLELGSVEPIIKHIPTAQTFQELFRACKQICKAAGVPKPVKLHKMRIVYLDVEGDKIEVTDDSELQMAYATALSFDSKVKFFIELTDYVHVVAPDVKPVEIVAPVVAAPE